MGPQQGAGWFIWGCGRVLLLLAAEGGGRRAQPPASASAGGNDGKRRGERRAGAAAGAAAGASERFFARAPPEPNPLFNDTMQHKRQMRAPAAPAAPQSADAAALTTLGMRIRKAVADGYHTPSAAGYSYNSRRVPLPAGMEQPPALAALGSTAGDSSSSLSEWEARGAAMQPVTLGAGGADAKRKMDLDAGYSRFREEVDYAQKYGSLLFNEEF